MIFRYMLGLRANRRMTEIQPVLISCHVAKTGGTSFRHMLEAAHGDRLVFIARMPGVKPIRRELYPLLRQTYWYARSIDFPRSSLCSAGAVLAARPLLGHIAGSR